MRILVILASMSLVSCASLMPSTTPGSVTSSTSDYDGTIQTSAAPSWAGGIGNIKVGAFKTSKMDKDEALLVVQNDDIKNFAFQHPNFFVKIDGVETPMSPIDKNSECNISTSTNVAHCQQNYRVKLSFLEKMVNAKSVKFKLLLRDNTYVTGNLDRSGWTTAKTVLVDFLKEIEKKGMASRATASQK